MKTRSGLLAVSAVAALTLSACGGSDAGASSGPTVVASFYPLAFVAEQVAGDHAQVDNLTQPGAESHDLELTGQQVGQVTDADLVVFLHGFQPSVDAAVEQNAEDAALDTGELVELIPADEGAEHDEHAEDEHAEEGEAEEHAEEGDEHDHGDLEGDPHIWLDPANMEAIASAVADRLAEIDPDNAESYQANADTLIDELDSLDQEFETGLAQCERTVFVTSHEAFGYLAHRYGLEQVGIAGVEPDAEPSPERLAEVHQVVQDEGVTTIFYERLVSPKVAETLATDLGVEAAVLDPIEGLTDDTSDEDYLTLMRANLAALQEANGCA